MPQLKNILNYICYFSTSVAFIFGLIYFEELTKLVISEEKTDKVKVEAIKQVILSPSEELEKVNAILNAKKTPYPTKYIANKIKSSNPKNVNDIIDFIRIFVHTNSIHLIDDEHNNYAFNPMKMVRWMVDVDKKKKQDKPHMSCSPRAYAMKLVLDDLKIKNRIVSINSGQGKGIAGHVFLEVQNTDDLTWHIQDPDYNVYYRDNTTNQRVSLFDMVFTKNLDKVTPIEDETVKGWEETKSLPLKSQVFFSIARYGFDKGNDFSNVVLINPKRMDIHKRFPKNHDKTYIEQMNQVGATHLILSP